MGMGGEQGGNEWGTSLKMGVGVQDIPESLIGGFVGEMG